METIIQKLYDNDWCKDVLPVQELDGHEDARKEALLAYQALEEKLCGELKAQLEDFISKNISVGAFNEMKAFTAGFKLAGRLFSEVYF